MISWAHLFVKQWLPLKSAVSPWERCGTMSSNGDVNIYIYIYLIYFMYIMYIYIYYIHSSQYVYLYLYNVYIYIDPLIQKIPIGMNWVCILNID